MDDSIQQSNYSDNSLSKVKIHLATMALARGAKVDRETIMLYASRLVREPLEDVQTALNRISEMEQNL